MTNLFKDWPAELIGVITDKIAETNPNTHYSYYQLGREEIKFPFPFSLFQSYVHSGPYKFSSATGSIIFGSRERHNGSVIKGKMHSVLDSILKYVGLITFFYSVKLSNSLRDWIINFNPQIIYIQPFHHRIMRFGNLLYKELKIPYAIHIMDDSVTYINHSFFFKKKIQNILDGDFKRLVVNSQVRMCISDSMATEYQRRYGKSFCSFRNPVDTEKWIPFQKKNFDINDGIFKIIYTGRLFSPTLNSLIDMCKAVDDLNTNSSQFVLDIYTFDKNPSFTRDVKKYKGIRLNNPVNVKDIPKLISLYDVFFLCLDFDRKAQNYSQFSISTRASEGMISGVPILVYAPLNSALFQYFNITLSGYVVGEENYILLKDALLKLHQDTSYRELVSKNAIKRALEESDSKIVRENFRKTLNFCSE